ncbi:MAG: Hsp20/alpha crystallin family protein [Salinisphaeraceae bacterium]|nr:Hsp20/alpha crystallin family protein [Salinisphaeraceae bacterium]
MRLYEPNTMLNRLHDEIGSLFGNSLDDATASAWSPAVDIKEDDSRYLIHADLPGIKPDDVNITLEKGVLTIEGLRESESNEERQGYRRVERYRGRFARHFALPDTADSEKVEAKLKDGVLEVVILKKESSKPRRIKVHA